MILFCNNCFKNSFFQMFYENMTKNAEKFDLKKICNNFGVKKKKKFSYFCKSSTKTVEVLQTQKTQKNNNLQ